MTELLGQMFHILAEMDTQQWTWVGIVGAALMMILGGLGWTGKQFGPPCVDFVKAKVAEVQACTELPKQIIEDSRRMSDNYERLARSFERTEQNLAHLLHRTEKGRTKTILVVEDDELDIERLRRILSPMMQSKLAYPHFCRSISEAQDHWYRADVVIADLGLPGEDWRTTLGFLTSSGKRRIILYTGMRGEELQAKSAELGVPIVNKDDDPAQLIAIVEGMLG